MEVWYYKYYTRTYTKQYYIRSERTCVLRALSSMSAFIHLIKIPRQLFTIRGTVIPQIQSNNSSDQSTCTSTQLQHRSQLAQTAIPADDSRIHAGLQTPRPTRTSAPAHNATADSSVRVVADSHVHAGLETRWPARASAPASNVAADSRVGPELQHRGQLTRPRWSQTPPPLLPFALSFAPACNAAADPSFTSTHRSRTRPHELFSGTSKSPPR